MATEIRFTVVGLKELQAKYKALGLAFKPGPEVRMLLKRMVEHMYLSVDRNFSAQGRPDAWKPLKPATLAARTQGRNKNPDGSKRVGLILQDTGRLRMSVTHSSGRGSVMDFIGTAVEFGTRLAYAAAHQFGFKGPVTQHVDPYVRKQHSRDVFEKVTKNGKARRMKVAGGIAFVREFTRTLNQDIPARPFLVFQPDDKDKLKAIVRDRIHEFDREHRVGGPKGKTLPTQPDKEQG